ncbi:MAG: hypothetical protein Q8Q89_02435 [bacterium]|nr:hypothetical protein [bacterium]
MILPALKWPFISHLWKNSEIKIIDIPEQKFKFEKKEESVIAVLIET